MKRPYDDVEGSSHSQKKRTKHASIDRLSSLSDELVLRIFTFIPVSQLVVCERISHKYRALASDSQLWRKLYYHHFVAPRASRLPYHGDGERNSARQLTNVGRQNWLHEEHLVRTGSRTNWKRQYKTRHNWTKGTCAISEVEVADQPTVPPILLQMQNGVIYMADKIDGLRAWSAAARKSVAQVMLPSNKAQPPPSCLAVDPSPDGDPETRVLIGFEDGSFSLYGRRYQQAGFRHLFHHGSSSNGSLSAAALSWPYAVTLTATQILSLYRFEPPASKESASTGVAAPKLLHSLRSRTVWPPLSASLRPLSSGVTICIAYALPTYLSGWTVGIQEIEVSSEGILIRSRLASAVDQHYRPLAFSAPPVAPYLGSPPSGSANNAASETIHIHTKPTSLSYTHPYLLVSHPDNTLTLYLVTSTRDALEISAGSRLWGHTSSVSGAHIGRRGKAVSVSKRGDELRVWELEGGFGSNTAKKRLATGSLSVQIRAGADEDACLRLNRTLASRVTSSCAKELREAGDTDFSLTRGWIGFDDENVVLLKEGSQGKQSLVVYDFT
ncbi:hypothetical protein K431DRAFT_232281 [Polychaeton citri CBS 116435]|uniref:F-box domain-containing protein n=1 Tax=Polychaeton citri CBS 116435 TaxID=1314669 RepID=A0A9P4UJC8_9PEZI|nr:hypothetical protein K431DRAFT_232281 [Polychaeton citri CBS 116435]